MVKHHAKKICSKYKSQHYIFSYIKIKSTLQSFPQKFANPSNSVTTARWNEAKMSATWCRPRTNDSCSHVDVRGCLVCCWLFSTIPTGWIDVCQFGLPAALGMLWICGTVPPPNCCFRLRFFAFGIKLPTTVWEENVVTLYLKIVYKENLANTLLREIISTQWFQETLFFTLCYIIIWHWAYLFSMKKKATTRVGKASGGKHLNMVL